VFIDGSNLLPRLRDAKLRIPSFFQLASSICGRRRLARVYFYTTQAKLDRVDKEHGPEALHKCRVVLGDSVLLEDGSVREKGVDALLVADLVYHAASRNCSFAAVLSNDTDFVVALRRVEDFGCNTGVLAVLREASPRLTGACDEYLYLPASELIAKQLALPSASAA
jgi:uncharacterized LabA/DUF88 family protein